MTVHYLVQYIYNDDTNERKIKSCTIIAVFCFLFLSFVFVFCFCLLFCFVLFCFVFVNCFVFCFLFFCFLFCVFLWGCLFVPLNFQTNTKNWIFRYSMSFPNIIILLDLPNNQRNQYHC